MPEPDALGALRARGEKDLGRRRVRVLLEEVVLDLPGVVDAQAVGELHLVERLLIELELAALAPRPRQLVLVEDAELHLVSLSCCLYCLPSYRAAARAAKDTRPAVGGSARAVPFRPASVVSRSTSARKGRRASRAAGVRGRARLAMHGTRCLSLSAIGPVPRPAEASRLAGPRWQSRASPPRCSSRFSRPAQRRATSRRSRRG